MNSFISLVQSLISSGMDPVDAVATANQQLGTSYSVRDYISGIGMTFEDFLNTIPSKDPVSIPTTSTVTSTTPTNTTTKKTIVPSSIKNWWETHMGPGNSIFQNFSFPDLAKLGSDFRNTTLFGEPGQGPTVAQAANVVGGLYQGGKAVKGLYENVNADEAYNSLRQDINSQIAANPMYDMYLDASDEKVLRQMRSGNLTNNWSGAFEGAARGIPKAALSAILGGMTGGGTGALIGGLGSLVNSGIEGYGQGTQEATSKLQGLYDRLRQADQEYRTMKRPNGLRRAGLSTQYYNQLY